VRPIVAIALGKLGDPDQLKNPGAEQALAPRTRLPLGTIAVTAK
jgi:hypothetical protein